MISSDSIKIPPSWTERNLEFPVNPIWTETIILTYVLSIHYL